MLKAQHMSCAVCPGKGVGPSPHPWPAAAAVGAAETPSHQHGPCSQQLCARCCLLVSHVTVSRRILTPWSPPWYPSLLTAVRVVPSAAVKHMSRSCAVSACNVPATRFGLELQLR